MEIELGSAVRRGVVVVATALAAVASGTLATASAPGDSTILVRGTDLPAGNRAQLTLVGCGSVFDRGAAGSPMIGISPGAGAIGKRSLAFAPSAGSAVGFVGYVESMARTSTAGVSVHSETGTSGVAYAGYQAPRDAGTDLMWIGRAVVAAPADGGWSTVDATGLGYDWTQYDMSTQQVVSASDLPALVPAFVRATGGDGYGFYAVAFGCDGNSFNLDGWRIGTAGATTTYDFEGYRTTTTIDGPDRPVEAGADVTLTGRVVDASGAPVGGRVVLEAKQDDGTWEAVDVAEGPDPTTVVAPKKTTTYRWKLYDRARYEGSVSEPFTVQVAAEDEPEAKDDANRTRSRTRSRTRPRSTAKVRTRPRSRTLRSLVRRQPHRRPSPRSRRRPLRRRPRSRSSRPPPPRPRLRSPPPQNRSPRPRRDRFESCDPSW